MNMIEGWELCPHCEYENHFLVDENTWTMKCKDCGRTILLCDRCEHCPDWCGKCPYEHFLVENETSK